MRLKDYFIASEINDYKPWIVTPQALGVFCFSIWLIRAFVPASFTVAAPGFDATDLMNRINAERTQRFIPALTINNKLISAASGKANDMLTRSYFAHVDPDGNDVWPRIEASGYKPYLTLGENLAIDFTSASTMVTAWMNSPTHRANIVNDKYEDQGLASISGTFEPGHDTIIAVSLFGTLIHSTKAVTPSPPSVGEARPQGAASPPVANPPQPQAIPTPKPAPTPKPSPAPAPAPIPIPKVQIFKDAKISTTTISGQILVNFNIIISGAPSLVTARLKSQSITLLAGKVEGEYVGSFTFDRSENLTKQVITVEARNKNGIKTRLDFPLNVEPPGVSGGETITIVPVSNEAQIIKILRIIFGVLAAIYMGFLVIDAIIIHRAKIRRAGIHSNPHALVFLLIAAVSIFANWA